MQLFNTIVIPLVILGLTNITLIESTTSVRAEDIDFLQANDLDSENVFNFKNAKSEISKILEKYDNDKNEVSDQDWKSLKNIYQKIPANSVLKHPIQAEKFKVGLAIEIKLLLSRRTTNSTTGEKLGNNLKWAFTLGFYGNEATEVDLLKKIRDNNNTLYDALDSFVLKSPKERKPINWSKMGNASKITTLRARTTDWASWLIDWEVDLLSKEIINGSQEDTIINAIQNYIRFYKSDHDLANVQIA